MVVAIAVVAFRWPSEPAPGVDIVKAVAVDDAKELKKLEAKRKKAEAKKKAEIKRKREEKKRKAEVERKRKEAEKKKLAEQKAKEEEKKKAEQRRLEEERRKLEEEKRRLAEEQQRIEEERRKEEEAERQRIEAERQLAESLEAEERERREADRKARALTAAEKYKLLIRQKVSRNWARPPGAQTGLQCTVRVKLVPTGEVLQVSVAKTSGNELFDQSVENAVYKASPLPLPEDRDLFEYFREIEFIFIPEN